MAARSKASARNRKRKTNLLKIHSAMNKMVEDAVDKEVVRKFRTIIDSSEEDLTRAQADEILKSPLNLNVGDFPESTHPYLRHFIFMHKREAKRS